MVLQRSPWGSKQKKVSQNEKAFQAQVVELAQTLGWWCWHPYYAAKSPKGYPDLTMFRERVIFAELKARNAKNEMGKLRAEQIEMAHRCFKAGVEYYTFYDTDEDWALIKAVLSRGGQVVAT